MRGHVLGSRIQLNLEACGYQNLDTLSRYETTVMRQKTAIPFPVMAIIEKCIGNTA